jgi:hypothetical protein
MAGTYQRVVIHYSAEKLPKTISFGQYQTLSIINHNSYMLKFGSFSRLYDFSIS